MFLMPMLLRHDDQSSVERAGTGSRWK
jgi:hypothetical protein